MTPNSDLLVITRLNEIIKELEQEVRELRDNGSGPICPKCNKERMITLTTIEGGIKLCGCGYKIEHKLDVGQKSILIDGLVGE